MNWISVKDRLPPPDVRVLVALDKTLWGDDSIGFGRLYVWPDGETTWRVEGTNGDMTRFITHWCELPEMPK